MIQSYCPTVINPDTLVTNAENQGKCLKGMAMNAVNDAHYGCTTFSGWSSDETDSMALC